MKRFVTLLGSLVLVAALALPALAAKPPKNAGVKSKFYDFSDQLIDGEIRRPTALFTDSRQKAKFDRLLRLKKSFLPAMFRTSKEKVFK